MSEMSVSRLPIKLTIEQIGEAKGELIRHLAPRTVGAILKRLPIERRLTVWKEEVYFDTERRWGVCFRTGELIGPMLPRKTSM